MNEKWRSAMKDINISFNSQKILKLFIKKKNVGTPLVGAIGRLMTQLLKTVK